MTESRPTPAFIAVAVTKPASRKYPSLVTAVRSQRLHALANTCLLHDPYGRQAGEKQRNSEKELVDCIEEFPAESRTLILVQGSRARDGGRAMQVFAERVNEIQRRIVPC